MATGKTAAGSERAKNHSPISTCCRAADGMEEFGSSELGDPPPDNEPRLPVRPGAETPDETGAEDQSASD